MDSERSNQVVGGYKKHKMNVSVMAGIRQLLIQFDADYATDRHWAWIGVVALIGLAMLAIYFFTGGSKITIS